jgi:hypothetical protein
VREKPEQAWLAERQLGTYVILYELGLVALFEIGAAVERAAEAMVVADCNALRRIVFNETQIGLRRVRRKRAVHLALVQHRGRKHVRAAERRDHNTWAERERGETRNAET